MKLRILPATSILEGDRSVLEEVHERFSFKDKAAESQIVRFKNGLYFKERSIAQAHGELPEEWLEWKRNKIAELKANVHVHCCELTDKELLVPTGLIRAVSDYLLDRSIKLSVTDDRNYDDLSKRILKGVPPPRLRKPQQQALDTIYNAVKPLEKGVGLIRLATGVGKTALAQELIRGYGYPSIFLVPSLPILKQTVERFEKAFGLKSVKAYGGGKKQLGYVTVATYQSVYKGDPEDFKDVALVVADECHHVAADTFFDVMQNKLKNASYRFGLTAYEERADGSTMLIESAVGPVIYKYDAAEAIADGYLAKPTYMIYDVWKTEGTWTKYKEKNGKRTAVSTEKSKEYDGDDKITAYRNWVLGNDVLNNFVAGLTQAFVDEGKSILILVDEVEHGDRLMKLIPNAGFCIGGGDDNERLQKEFNARKLKVLIGTSTLGEGADTVPVDVLIELQGGASHSKTLQADGRALRNETDENGVPRKPTTLIIDFNFPQCKILSRHSKMREQVHKTMGEIHRSKIG